MPSLSCPNCGAENELGAERCQECDAALFQDADLASSSDADFGFDPKEEQDLPDLLHALKQDGVISADGQVLDEGSTAEAPGPEEFDPAQAEADIPDWLKRIRERAKEEDDAAGEITQKLSAAQESLTQRVSDTQHEGFASWIQGLRGETGGERTEAPMEDKSPREEVDNNSEEPPEWLSKIRKVKGGAHGGDPSRLSDPGDKKGDSLLQWLVALEEGKESIQPIPREVPEALQESSPDSLETSEEPGEATQKIPAVTPPKGKAPALDVSREEQIQANLFSSLVVDERAPRPLREPERKRPSWVIRLVTVLLLIGALSAALFGGWPGARFTSPSPGAEVFLSSIAAWPETDSNSVLIVADYQAGFAEEIHQVAKPVLGLVLQPGMEVAMISTQPAGVLLSRRLMAELPNAGELRIDDLGYYPSSILGAYAAGGFSSGRIAWAVLPEPQSISLPDQLNGVFILADSYEGARVWVEQFSARNPELPLYLLVTAQAAPLLTPYQDSGQIAGMFAGLAGMSEMDISPAEEGILINLEAAYQTGTLLLAVMIIVGAFFAGKPKQDKKRKGGL